MSLNIWLKLFSGSNFFCCVQFKEHFSFVLGLMLVCCWTSSPQWWKSWLWEVGTFWTLPRSVLDIWFLISEHINTSFLSSCSVIVYRGDEVSDIERPNLRLLACHMHVVFLTAQAWKNSGQKEFIHPCTEMCKSPLTPWFSRPERMKREGLKTLKYLKGSWISLNFLITGLWCRL